MDLLADLLQFNPGFRPTAEECLHRDMFDSLRMNSPILELSVGKAENIIYSKGQFDYDENVHVGLQHVDYEKMLAVEASRFKRANTAAFTTHM